jgi:hypothetical protein
MIMSEEINQQEIIENEVPIGIERIREEWRLAGLVESEVDSGKQVVFSEIDGGAGIGDYELDTETVKSQLALSDAAICRLAETGELDNILIENSDGELRRLFSSSSINRFKTDSAIDSEAVTKAAKAMADKEVALAIEDLQLEIQELRATQGKILQQMKDMLLLEVRNLKEQDRDLSSYIYELAEEVRRVLPKKKR